MSRTEWPPCQTTRAIHLANAVLCCAAGAIDRTDAQFFALVQATRDACKAAGVQPRTIYLTAMRAHDASNPELAAKLRRLSAVVRTLEVQPWQVNGATVARLATDTDSANLGP